ncbi:MAG: metallophosphoesterase [Oscillospiraceae bacterium]
MFNKINITSYSVECENLPPAFSGKKILHLSDLHQRTFGESYEILLNKCKELDPCCIFFTGDLYSRTEKNLDKKPILMQKLLEIAPVYYVFGNHEADTPEKAVLLAEKLEAMGVHVLRNRHERIYTGSDFINIYGAKIDKEYYKNPDGSYKNLPTLTADTLNQMIGTPERNQFNILLAHSPFPFEEYAKWGADLVFSGHCHGGIIRLPVLGGILSPERKFFPEYTKGIYRSDKNGSNSQMILSAGLGKFRFNNPPEVVYVTLKAKKG